jgi:uncharacterized protein YxeA
MKKILLFLFVIICLSQIVTADINLGTFKKSDCIELQQTCDNCTYVNVTTITYPNSSLIYLNKAFTKTGTKYNYSFCSTTSLGNYIYSVIGNKNGKLLSEEGNFEITYTGDSLSTQKSILYVALLGLLIFFFILIIYFAGKIPDSKTRNEEGGIIAISNLKYLGSVLIFIDWMLLIAIFYITSNLAFAYLGEVLFAKILFAFFTVCFRLTIPIILVWFIWIFVQIVQDKKIKNMIEKGFYPMGGKGW